LAKENDTPNAISPSPTAAANKMYRKKVERCYYCTKL